MGLRDEILEQPAVAARLLDEGRPVVERIARVVRDHDPEFILIAARGTSDHAAIYGQYLFGAHLGLPVALAAPSLASLYRIDLRLGRAVVIGISQSGRSPDIVGMVESGRRQGAPTIALTNDPSSDLAAAAEHLIDLRAGPERAVAATKTYTAELLAVALLATAIESAPEETEALAAVPDALAAAFEAEPAAEGIARALADRDHCIVVGRGFEYSTARELALKLKELARFAADPYSAADFLHGPLALVEPGYPVIAIAPSGATAADMDALIGRLRELGVEPVVVSDRPAALDGGPSIALPAGLPEWLMPIVSIVPGQLLALHLALARGIDPEAPRWIGKITLTH